MSFESVKERALLAYLAVEAGRLHSRESLAALLWPDRPDSAALANLRHALSRLRAALGERDVEGGSAAPLILSVPGGSIQFNSEAGIWLDLEEWTAQLTAAGREAADDPERRVQHLQTAVELYRGRFMEGFSLKGCLEYENWMLLHRENLSLQVQKALRSLSDAHIELGAWELALSALRQLLQIEPWDESAHRQVMKLLAWQNMRSAALAQFEQCRRILSNELGVEPDHETVSLFEQIRQDTFTGPLTRPDPTKHPTRLPWLAGASPGSNPVNFVLPKPKLPRFVGRQQQIERLRGVLDQALSGRGQVIFIKGEAGSGKTSLAWEFAYQAMELHSDLLAAAGRCNAITGIEDPYLPFRELVQMLAGVKESQEAFTHSPEHLRRLNSAFPDILKSLLTAAPELIKAFFPSDSLTERIATYGPGMQSLLATFQQTSAQPATGSGSSPLEPVARMVHDLARRRPLFLFLDDLQWADVGSIALLHYLCKRLSGSRVVLIGAYRAQDVAAGRRDPLQGMQRHPLEPVRHELQREFGELEIDLDELSNQDFVHDLIDSEPNHLLESFRQTLHQHTNGNPLFTLELLRNMQARGDIIQDTAGYWVEGSDLDWNSLPARVEAVIAERIARLPADQQALLRAASVEGETFTAEVLSRLVNLPVHQVIQLLSGPLSREHQLVLGLQVQRFGPLPGGQGAALGQRSSRYRFRHILFQKYLLSHLDPVERTALHEAIGYALEDLFEVWAEEMALQMGWHFEQAGLPGRAVEHLLVAGKQAMNLSAYRQAYLLYERCLRLIQQMPDSAERSRLEVQALLARSAPMILAVDLGTEALILPQVQDSLELAISLMQGLGWPDNHPDFMLALYFQCNFFTLQGNMYKAVERGERLLQLLSADTEPALHTLANMAAGQAYLLSGKPAAAVEYLEKGKASWRPQDARYLTAMSGNNILLAYLTWISFAEWLLGRTCRSQELQGELLSLARSQDYLLSMDTGLGISGALLGAIMGDEEMAGNFARECLKGAKPDSSPIGRVISQIILGWIQARQGQIDLGLASILEGMEEWPSTLNSFPMSVIFLADALSLGGQTEIALQMTARAKELIDQTGRRMMEAYVHWLEGEIISREQSRRGDQLEFERSPEACYERSIEVAHQQQALSLKLRAVTSLARLLSQTGRAEEARVRLREVCSFFEGECETPDLRAARILLAELGAEPHIPKAERE